MSQVAALLVGVGVGASLVFVAQAIQIFTLRRIERTATALTNNIMSTSVRQVPEQEPVDAEVVEEQDVDEPLDMHPTIPPVWRTARVDRPDLKCSCHGNPVKAGEKMLWWTRPDETVVLYCPEVVTEAEREAGLA